MPDTKLSISNVGAAGINTAGTRGTKVEPRVDALRQLGEILRIAPKAKGGEQYKEIPTGTNSEPVPTLADLGIDKKTSSIAQKNVVENILQCCRLCV